MNFRTIIIYLISIVVLIPLVNLIVSKGIMRYKLKIFKLLDIDRNTLTNNEVTSRTKGNKLYSEEFIYEFKRTHVVVNYKFKIFILIVVALIMLLLHLIDKFILGSIIGNRSFILAVVIAFIFTPIIIDRISNFHKSIYGYLDDNKKI